MFIFSLNYVISVLLHLLCYAIFSVTMHSSAVPTILFQFPVMETVQLGGAVLCTANGRSDSLVHHQSQRGIVIGDILHQYKILFSGGLEPFWYPRMTFSGYITLI